MLRHVYILFDKFFKINKQNKIYLLDFLYKKIALEYNKTGEKKSHLDYCGAFKMVVAILAARLDIARSY